MNLNKLRYPVRTNQRCCGQFGEFSRGPKFRRRLPHRWTALNWRLPTMAQNEGERSVDESTSPTIDAAKKADRAVRDMARTYLEKFGVKLDLEQIEKSIRDKPLPSAAI